MVFFDTTTQHCYTDAGLRQRGLNPENMPALVAMGIHPVRHNPPAYDANLYTLEPDGVPAPAPDGWYEQRYSLAPAAVDAAKARLKVVVQNEKCHMRDRGVEFEGMTWDTDGAARIAYVEMAAKLQSDPDYTTIWRASPGSWASMDAVTFARFQAVYEAHVQTCFAWQAEREAEIDACTSIDELATVTLAAPGK